MVDRAAPARYSDLWIAMRTSRSTRPVKKDAPRFPGARVISNEAVRLAAAGTAVARAAFAAAIAAGAGSRRRGRQGQAGNRQKCDDEFFHFLDSPLRFRSNVSSANMDGSRRRVSPQARGGGTGGR